MGRQFERWMDILDTLGRGGGLDVDAIAAKFGVSPNCVLVDVYFLRSSGYLENVFPQAVPGECEACNKSGRRVTHHWIDYLGFHTKQLCLSCNAKLGAVYKGHYPVWEEQVQTLKKGE